MPRKYCVSSLSDMCGKSLENALFSMSETFLNNERASLDEYTGRIESCKQELSSTPSTCHNLLAEHSLKAADRIAKQYCLLPENSLKSEVVVQHLVSIVTHLKLEKLYFSSWSEPVQASLLNFLWKMTHLKTLHYSLERKSDSSLTETEIEHLKRLHKSLPFLTNLTKFEANDCTDEIIATLCENCKLLEEIDVSGADEVTDKCIDSLVCCTKLRSVSLTDEVSAEGFVRFLQNTQSKNLVEIGGVAFFDELLSTLEETIPLPSCLFQIQRVVSTELFEGLHLDLVAKYFPCLTSLNVHQDVEKILNFSCLDSLKHLKEAELRIYANRSDSLNPFYSLESQVLTKLTISGVLISLRGLINVGLQCPNLESFDFEEDCSFVKDVDFLTVRTLGRPFQKLKSFSLYSNSSASGAELILILTSSIETIWILENDSLTDAFFTSILKYNSLKELKCLGILPGSNVSLNMVKSILLDCKNINELSCFSGFEDAASNKEKLESLKKFITQNKYNINLH